MKNNQSSQQLSLIDLSEYSIKKGDILSRLIDDDIFIVSDVEDNRSYCWGMRLSDLIFDYYSFSYLREEEGFYKYEHPLIEVFKESGLMPNQIIGGHESILTTWQEIRKNINISFRQGRISEERRKVLFDDINKTLTRKLKELKVLMELKEDIAIDN